MADLFPQSQRHNCMAKVRTKGTRPEVTHRRCLHRKGLRFRVNVKSLPRTLDIVLAKYRTTIFVNGCFRHGNSGCRYYTHPKTNPEFWEEKVKRNIEHDLVVASRLETLNWHVIIIWECGLKKTCIEDTIDRLIEQIRTNLESWNQFKARRKEDRAYVLGMSGVSDSVPPEKIESPGSGASGHLQNVVKYVEIGRGEQPLRNHSGSMSSRLILVALDDSLVAFRRPSYIIR